MEEIASQPLLAPTDVKCPKCERTFVSHQAMRVHLARSKAHGGGWSTLKKGKRKQYPSESKAFKRKHYLIAKARYAKMGLNARGQPFKDSYLKGRSFKPIVYKAPAGPVAAEKPQPTHRIRFCPCCGENIERHLQ